MGQHRWASANSASRRCLATPSTARMGQRAQRIQRRRTISSCIKTQVVTLATLTPACLPCGSGTKNLAKAAPMASRIAKSTHHGLSAETRWQLWCWRDTFSSTRTCATSSTYATGLKGRLALAPMVMSMRPLLFRRFAARSQQTHLEKMMPRCAESRSRLSSWRCSRDRTRRTKQRWSRQLTGRSCPNLHAGVQVSRPSARSSRR
mmetsp:Transcript_66830/g.105721  ORF Transcript_66830/g.105721 Transcript_66830/m.105721 type:complete len:205 (-) Transcript_66830:1457-2071(-)